mmetsp:Transcript_8276/g.12737  ORF Transcript_8276/g.12737 Transcript_8276/m.12737 type:complete len:244 (-) Transcript_8276:11-742(-)
MITRQQPYDLVITEDGYILEFENDTEISVVKSKGKQIRGKTRKHVSFDTEAYMAMVEHSIEYTEEERRRCWYAKSDLTRMKQETQSTIQRMRFGEEVLDTENHCSRGLEHSLPFRSFERKTHRNHAWLSVFKEQTIQDTYGVINQDKIAQAYISANKCCAHEAHKTGLSDASWVRKSNDSYSVKGKRKLQNSNTSWGSNTRTRGMKCDGGEYMSKRRKAVDVPRISTTPFADPFTVATMILGW